jgi:hypothetical protein
VGVGGVVVEWALSRAARMVCCGLKDNGRPVRMPLVYSHQACAVVAGGFQVLNCLPYVLPCLNTAARIKHCSPLCQHDGACCTAQTPTWLPQARTLQLANPLSHSLLAHLRPIQVGVHGLIIEFQDPSTRSRRSATFLPEVARDQGWDQQQTLAALVKKAGGWASRVGLPAQLVAHIRDCEQDACHACST